MFLIALFSVLLLASQVSLTRLFSAIFFYHFAFLIISTAFLGFALGGLLIRVLRDRIEAWNPDRSVAVGVAASGVLLVFALYVIAHSPFRPGAAHHDAAELAKLLIAVAAVVLPFTVIGATVLLLLQRWSEDVDRLYGANLLGSGCGCLVAILILNLVGALHAYLALAAAAPLLASWYLFAVDRKLAVRLLALGALLLAAIPFSESILPLTGFYGKNYTCRSPRVVVFHRWTALSRVDICRDRSIERRNFGLWGLSRRNRAPLPERLGVVIDSWAYTTILKHRKDTDYYEFLDSLPMYLAYEWTDRPQVMIIGSGGGMDIRAALHFGAKEVDAVEINPSIMEALHGELASYAGHIYTQAGVHGHLAEGRSFAQASDKRYDVIQLSGVDTLTTTQAGAFALSESFLYTREAMQTYLGKLTEDGVLTLTRWFHPDRRRMPRLSLRLFTLAVESLSDFGAEDPGSHIMFIESNGFTVILIKRKPITEAEIEAVASKVEAKAYRFLYRPDHRGGDRSVFGRYLRARDRTQWIAAYPYQVKPPTDDSPFFFELRKPLDALTFRFLAMEAGLDGQSILTALLFELLAACVVLLVISYRLEGKGSRPMGWLYFFAIGAGFMLVEVTFIQRLVLFLGHPTYALSVVISALLIFSGLGATVSERLDTRISVRLCLASVSVLMLLWALGGTTFVRSLIWLSLPLRVGITVGVLALPAFLMGTAFPGAVRRLNAAGESQLGLYWAWNGVGSVLASVVAVMIAMTWGFSTVMVVAACCYGIAALVLPSLGGSHSGS
jgi:spermidine synthase